VDRIRGDPGEIDQIDVAAHADGWRERHPRFYQERLDAGHRPFGCRRTPWRRCRHLVQDVHTGDTGVGHAEGRAARAPVALALLEVGAAPDPGRGEADPEDQVLPGDAGRL